VKIKHMAAAALLPATIAGVTLGASGAAHAATQHGVSQHGPTGVTRRAAYRPRHKGDRRWVTVQAGDTLSGIAAAHHMSWEAIYATPPNMRDLRKPADLRAGQHLRIPENPGFREAQFRIRYAAGLSHELGAFAHDRARPGRSGPARERASRPAEEAVTQSAQTAPAQPLTAGMSSFEQCVAFRESTDTPTDPDGLFGILPSTWAELGYSGTAGQASVALQKIAFNRLYAEYGAQPWAPSDGC
jgi:LysM repeat protein